MHTPRNNPGAKPDENSLSARMQPSKEGHKYEQKYYHAKQKYFALKQQY